ncbi:GNAT family N-acetyltransferase [Devosia albogilva]|uniref:GNAT family N-acetyltransferase n=1 Tax=Devosia albogilva TaxID=429726 RepID=A0ABW5QPB1_9HYPH
MANIVEASSSADFDSARRLMRALVEWGRELSAEDRHLIDRYFDPAAFDAELAGLPGRYAPPTGRLLLAKEGDRAVGCVAMRPLEPGVCEMKRMFIEPECHGRGIGKALATRLIKEARASGYDVMRLDTSRHQAPAISLYEKFGFLRRSAYYDAPEGSEGFLLFFEKDLHAPP